MRMHDLLDDPEAAWSPYRPSASEPWDEARVAHLHSRAGFGGQLASTSPSFESERGARAVQLERRQCSACLRASLLERAFPLVFVIFRSVLSLSEQTSSNYATVPKIRGRFTGSHPGQFGDAASP